MAAEIAMAAESTTLVLNGTPIVDTAEGSFITLTPVNPLTSHTNSASGGVNINKRMDGDVFDLAVIVQKYSDNDVFLNSAVNQEFPVIFNGSCKENYVKNGVAGVESWNLVTGSFTTRPTEEKNNQEATGSVTYTIRFRTAQRAL